MSTTNNKSKLIMDSKTVDTILDDIDYLNHSMTKKLKEGDISDSTIQTYLVSASRIVHELTLEVNRRNILNDN